MIHIINIFWLLDVMNFEFMEMFDTTYPLNSLFWFFVIVITADWDSMEKQERRNRRRNNW